jgi:hypothetical protein
MAETVEEREAKQGEKMIEVKVRFWTNDIAQDGKIVPKHGRTAGVVRITSNMAHGLKPRKPIPFNSLLELPAMIEKLLLEQGVVLHASRRMRKYLAD